MPRGQTEGEDYWRELIAAWEASGLPQTKFAKQQDVSVWTLRAWVARLKASEAEPIEDTSDAEGESLDDLLVAAAEQHGELSAAQVADAIGVTTRKARQYLRWLVEEGRLKTVGRTKATRYLPGDG